MTTWVLTHDETVTLLHAKGAPARWDLQVTASWSLPDLAVRRAQFRARMCHQIRQDIWRKLKDLRGFSPMVAVDLSDQPGRAQLLTVQAGGSIPVQAHLSPRHREQVESLLNEQDRQNRWMRHAARSSAFVGVLARDPEVLL